MNPRLEQFYLSDTLDPLYVVVIMKEGLYLESPSDRDLLENEPQEALLRLFVEAKDAFRYQEAIEELGIDQELKVIRVSVDNILKTIDVLEEVSQRLFGCSLCIDFSHTRPGEWPESLDILWSKYSIKH